MTDQPWHPDPDQLADHAEGLLVPAESGALVAHLEDCTRCQADLDQLQALPAWLAAAAPVGPLPDGVLGRLDRALADAAAGAESARSPTVVPLSVTERPRGMRLLQAAAVTVLVLAGGAVGITALLGGGGAHDGAGGGSAASAPKAADQSFPLTASGKDWTEQSVVAAVPELVSGRVGERLTATPFGPSPSGSAQAREQDKAGDDGAYYGAAQGPVSRLAGGPALAQCVTALAGAPAGPVSVDLASFQHEPAAVVVLATPGDPATVDLWVVGADCGQADAQVRFFARVDR